MRHQPGPEVVKHNAKCASSASADDHGRPKNTARAPAADGQSGREDLTQGDGQQESGTYADILSHGVLDGRVAEGEHGEHLLLASQGEVQEKPNQPR